MSLRFFTDRFQTVLLLSALLMLPTASAFAQIDPTLYFLQNIITSEGLKSPVFGPSGYNARGGIDEHGARVLLRFQNELDAEQIALLESNGIQFARDPNAKNHPVLHNHTLYRAYVPWSSLPFLENYPPLLRAEAGWSPLMLRPLEHTSALVGAAAANILPGLGVDGQGVRIGNIDSGIDILHPAFFHADGGYFSWIDVNNNGQFDPGIDVVDVNNNGAADRNEILRVLDGSFVKDFNDPQVQNHDGILQTRSDWLYADLNQDRQRNTGRASGFDEQTPAYGEPLFVVDDVNGNGQLDIGEKLVRLKTSKIHKLVESNIIYERGRNLIDAATAQSLENSFHGTGVSGILVGGQPGFHDRVGLAPAADLIVYVANSEDWENTIAAYFIEDAILQNVDVLLHEWTECSVHAMDGSSNLEAAMDRARDAGVLQVNPAGNLNLSQKTIHLDVPAGQNVDLNFDVKSEFFNNNPDQPYSVILGSIHWQGHARPKFSLQPPNGVPEAIELNAQIRIDNAVTHWTYERTGRGTHLVTFYIWTTEQNRPLPTGRWNINITDIATDSTFLGRISDYYSGWGQGIVWTRSTADKMTLCFPATADSAIGVAAYGGRHDRIESDNSRIGELRNYSSRGPRLDGRPQVALSAPDDPYSPLAATPQMLNAGWGQSWYAAFGGTSGAGPHVAAAVALLRQQNPDWSPEQLENRLYETADFDPLASLPTTLPDPGWGWGKLNIYRALYNQPIPQNQPPVAALTVEYLEHDDLLRFDASASTDPDGDSLEFRFDLDYDGIWETDWSATASTTISTDFFLEKQRDNAQPFYARLEVRDPGGARAGALALIPWNEEPHPAADIGIPDDFSDVGPTQPLPTPPGISGQHTKSDGCTCNTVAPRTTFPVYSWLACATLLGFRWRLRSKNRIKNA